jgi:hypothetical protein
MVAMWIIPFSAACGFALALMRRDARRINASAKPQAAGYGNPV